jgi:DNA topoisomerase-1
MVNDYGNRIKFLFNRTSGISLICQNRSKIQQVYTLVVCEKPDAARRIAHALGTPKESRSGGIPVFEVASHDTRYVVTSAIGHLYGVSDNTTSRSVYPVLDLEWAPLQKNARAARAIKVISDLSKKALSFIHACDYDQEGEVIGYTILEYACNGMYEKSRRAKFSTLTDEEIRHSFANLSAPSAGLAEAGRSRHVLDYLYGINLSRALSKSFKAAKGGYHNLSIGRVQGPTLGFAVNREFEVRLHVPDPFWSVSANLAKQGEKFLADYVRSKIDTVSEASKIHESCTGSDAIVAEVENRRIALRPPTPFNLGDLQREAFRVLKVSPGYTLGIAEKLYLLALISYPRTSSQKLPQSIGYSKIISGLAKIGSYSRLASMVLSRPNLSPNEGKMSDPAHPSIYPTGVAPRSKLGGLEFKVFDLIVKRFLATFGDSAVTMRTDVSIDIAGNKFVAQGNEILYDGWMVIYRPYVNLERHLLPHMQAGERLDNTGIDLQEKFTQPARRFNQASLLAKMEQEKIGTKATRADIIGTLFKRNYVASSREGIEVTDLGLAVIESMKEFAPSIISTGLTRDIEERLENIETGRGNSVDAIAPAVDSLVESLSSFMQRELEIGAKIGDAAAFDRRQAATIGSCPICKTGQLRVITSFKTKKRFVGCSNYSEDGCKASTPLPQRGAIKTSGKTCGECGWPVVGIVFARRSKQWRICVNISCPAKKK